MELTLEQIEQNNNIPSHEIEQDIKETKIEIDQYRIQILTLTADRQGNKLDIYMREGKISQREEFINKLNSILEYRKK